MTERVFVVTINYNSASEVSKLAKYLRGIPIIVVDNASREEDLQAIQSLVKAVKDLILIENKINLGFAKGANMGIREALKKGADAIVLVNPDLRISKEQINKLVQTDSSITGPVLTFKRNGQTIYDLGGKVNWMIGRTTHHELTNLSATDNFLPEYVSGACMAIKKEVFEKIGLFDERFFMYLEDADLCLRARKAGLSVVVNRNVIVNHQIDEHRQSKNLAKIRYNLKSNYLFIRKWLPFYLQPFGLAYFLLLSAKVLFNQLGK